MVVVGILFGLVFDTATQAAAWGAAASARSGLAGAAVVSVIFAAGMILTDTLDSRIVAVLLRRQGASTGVTTYRRGVGWIIVGLSFGMAAYTLLTKLGLLTELPDQAFSILGLAAAVLVTVVLVAARGRSRPSPAAAFMGGAGE